MLILYRCCNPGTRYTSWARSSSLRIWSVAYSNVCLDLATSSLLCYESLAVLHTCSDSCVLARERNNVCVYVCVCMYVWYVYIYLYIYNSVYLGTFIALPKWYAVFLDTRRTSHVFCMRLCMCMCAYVCVECHLGWLTGFRRFMLSAIIYL